MSAPEPEDLDAILIDVIRGEDGVWRQRGGAEIPAPLKLYDEGEAELIDEFAAYVDHNGEPSAVVSFLDESDRPLPPRSGKIKRREITALEAQIAAAESQLKILKSGTILIRGKRERIAELEANLLRLKEAHKMLSTPITVHVIRRGIRSDTVRARRPRDPNKIQ